MKTVRCAIYTRKSSDEGLEQGFNSLDAQREACAAYILSQAGEGWTALPDHYDDGGLSGGTLERPALQRLLADIRAGRVDIVVVYKVDRLSRSLFDFAKLVELFEQAGTSFVSITQAFNTTSSMGRLTLNMLLSFAQFEREVTAERIRDKIAASKAKGMWMGGIPPIGYAPDGRSLRIVEDHAALVRLIFARYLALGNVRLLEEELNQQGFGAPARTLITGKPIGARPLARGQLYKMLRCPTYVGDVVHQGKTYPGLHLPIIDRDTFDRVQALITDNRQGQRYTRAPRPALLAGKVVDEAGAPLVPVHATKGKVRYGYYVSRALQRGESETGARIPARELDIAVASRLAEAFDDPLALMVQAGLDVLASDIASYAGRARDYGATVRKRARPELQSLLRQVQLQPHGIALLCDAGVLAAALGVPLAQDAEETFAIRAPARLTRSGRAMRLIQEGRAAPQLDRTLVRLLGQAHLYWCELRTGTIDIKRLAAREQISAPYITRVVRLALLSPAVVTAILAGRQRPGVSGKAMIATGAIDPAWAVQARAFLPSV
jgi:DNA invertase Pin-like site-specific DNA recombinase